MHPDTLLRTVWHQVTAIVGQPKEPRMGARSLTIAVNVASHSPAINDIHWNITSTKDSVCYVGQK